jgi:hypothetical protein
VIALHPSVVFVRVVGVFVVVFPPSLYHREPKQIPKLEPDVQRKEQKPVAVVVRKRSVLTQGRKLVQGGVA